MKPYFAKLPTKMWLLFVAPAVVIGYPVAQVVVPTVIHAVVPEVVTERTALHLSVCQEVATHESRQGALSAKERP